MKITALIIAFFTATLCFAQSPNPQQKFSPSQLKADLSFIKQQLFNAHANPFTEIDKTAYEKIFDRIETQLTDSMTATSFFKMVRPTVSPLSDEHAHIRIAANLQTDAFKKGNTFLPFNLLRKGNEYIVDDVLEVNTGLKKGDVIVQVNGLPIADLVKLCASYTTGFPSQRADNALQQFGYLYTISQPNLLQSFDVKTANGTSIAVKGTVFNIWLNYLTIKAGMAGHTTQTITYQRYGNTAYLTTTAFDARNDKEMDSLRKVVAGMFGQMKTDGVKNLFVDVSRNSGGNSAVGDMLIDFFYNKSYRTYQCNWKRSDEYLSLIKSWGINNDFYSKQPVGKVIHFDSEQKQVSKDNPLRFNGKTYVVIGDGTFSSAMMFATIIKDNHIATLVGQVPKGGHPTHFGEMYNTKLPNTQLDLLFGVKEWIRPAGKGGENILRPDRVVDLGKGAEGVIREVVR